MITTRLTNKTDYHSQQLVDESGAVMAGVTICFAICTARGKVVDGWDVAAKQRIVPRYKEVVTDDNGEFEIDLWPTSRGINVYYRCSVPLSNVSNIIAPLDESTTPVTWFDFMAAGQTLTPTGLSVFSNHINDNTRHLSSAMLAFLSQCSVSTDGLPLWDSGAWPGDMSGVPRASRAAWLGILLATQAEINALPSGQMVSYADWVSTGAGYWWAIPLDQIDLYNFGVIQALIDKVADLEAQISNKQFAAEDGTKLTFDDGSIVEVG